MESLHAPCLVPHGFATIKADMVVVASHTFVTVTSHEGISKHRSLGVSMIHM